MRGRNGSVRETLVRATGSVGVLCSKRQSTAKAAGDLEPQTMVPAPVSPPAGLGAECLVHGFHFTPAGLAGRPVGRWNVATQCVSRLS